MLFRSHVLSFDLDQLYAFCEVTKAGLESTSTDNYFQWLDNAGMNYRNYDAVLIYTSPGYCHKNVAQEGLKRVVSLF